MSHSYAEIMQDVENIVYEDGETIVVNPKEGMAEGHLKIFPRRNVRSLKELPRDIAIHLFKVASKCASAVFEGLGAHGTNIICNDNLNEERLCIDVVTRRQDDGIDIMWKPEPAKPEHLDKIKSSISPHTEFLTSEFQNEKREEPNKSEKEDHEDDDRDSEDEINYLIRSINRIP